MAAGQVLKSVGKRTTRLNGPDIVTGSEMYADDIQLPGMLYGRIVRSPHGYARIRKIDVSRARALSGVVEVVTASDIPELSILAGEEVCYQGEKVALVAAVDPDVAEDALHLIEVDYEVLPAATDPVAAMAPDAPIVKAGAPCEEVTDEDGRQLRNVASHTMIVEGDVEKGFAEADAIVEAEYSMPFFHQTYMEPNAATARVEANGRLTLWSSGQGSFSLRSGVAGALKIPEGQIRVIMLEMGGGFGAKNGIFTEPHACLLALRTGRPVKVTMNREEEFLDGRPAPGCWVRLKTGAKKDGTITAIEGRIVGDGGVTGRGGSPDRLLNLYRVPPHVKLEGFGVRTNKPGPGAYRAPGAPQAAVPREGNMDLLALKLGMDPVAIRLKNALKKGDRTRSGAPLPHDWLRMTIRKAAAAAKWGKVKLKPNQGMGIACGEWQNAAGQTNAFLTMAADGSVSMVTGQVDITGLHTVMAQIASEELGVPVSDVTVTLGDTDTVPFTGLSAGSKAAYSAGTAAREAAIEARGQLLKQAAEMLEVPAERLVVADGKVKERGKKRSISLAEVAGAASGSRAGPISGRSVIGRIPTYPSFSVQIATVEVDPDTGGVRLIDMVAAQDVGRALNPMLVEGQIEGGAIQAAGFGMMEAQRYDNTGKLLNPNLLDYAIPTMMDVPQVKTVLVEVPCELGPYGAKGVGEPPIIPGAAAIANAVQDAVGVQVGDLPLTPERVVAAMRRRGSR